MVVYMKPPDMNDSFSRIVLDNREYLIRFQYNGARDFWTYGIYDTEEKQIMQHRKIVPVSPLNHFDVQEGFPSGIFGCLTDLKKVGRKDFENGNAEFIYIPWEDLKDWSDLHGIIR